MKYCSTCGKEIAENQDVCLGCGVRVNKAPVVSDEGGFAFTILGFLIPIVGLILWLVWKDTKPNSSNAAKKGFLAYLIFLGVCFAFGFIVGFIGAFV